MIRVVADDVAGGESGEVGAEDEDCLVGPFGEEARAGERGGLRTFPPRSWAYLSAPGFESHESTTEKHDLLARKP